MRVMYGGWVRVRTGEGEVWRGGEVWREGGWSFISSLNIQH